MAIINDLKNAISNSIYEKDADINFYFNKIEKADFPFIFLYFPSFKLEKAIDCDYWRKLNLMGVLEYQKNESNSQAELWEITDLMSKAVSNFSFLDTTLNARNIEFKTVDDVMQMTFDLEFYVKEIDETELMRELEFTFKRSFKKW